MEPLPTAVQLCPSELESPGRAGSLLAAQRVLLEEGGAGGEESVAEVSRQDLGLVLWKLGPRRLLDISVCRKQQPPGSEDS